MAFEDTFRISVHAVITDKENRVLLLKATYGDMKWGLPGGSLEPGETILEALHRECQEEIGTDIEVQYLSGVYYHAKYNSHVMIFRGQLSPDATLQLSSEHSEYRYFGLEELTPVQRQRVEDCLNFKGNIYCRKFE